MGVSPLFTSRLRAVAATAGAAAMLAACTSPASMSSGPATLRMAAVFLPTSLDPAKGIDAIFAFVETLTHVDDHGNVIPFLLARAPERVDAEHWVLTLRKVYDVWVRYGTGSSGHDVLRGVSLTVRPGEIVGVQGPSGCGKSTLLRVATTLESPTRGTVRVAGRSLCRGRHRDGTVMPVSQNSSGALDPRWPIWRTITEPLTARHRDHHIPTARRRDIAREHLRTVGLAGLDIHARPGRLSGGQCQRVAILRALIVEPRLLVADEPTAALDVSAAAGVLRLLAGAADRGIAILIAGHDRNALQVLCHRVMHLRDGHLH